MADPNPWTDNPWTTQGKAFKDWTTTEALDAARKFAEQMKSDPDLKGSACQILFPLIDWALDILDDYNKLTGDQVTMEEVAKTFACIGLATPEFLAALLGNLVLFKRRQYGAMDPCMIASMARLGMCYLRNAMNQTLAPDLLEFWLFGKAADTANLSVESVQLTDPEGQAFGQTLSYKPVESSTVMARIGTLIDGAVEDAYLPLLSKICERLQAPANTRFPKSAQRVLNQAIEIAPGRNALQEDGFQVLYSEQSFMQNSTVDPELYILGTSGLLSEIRVRATRGQWTNPDGGATENGWEVSFEGWKVRFWDYFDFHAGTLLYVPLGSGDLAVPDELFTRIRPGWDCTKFSASAATPCDYLLMSDSWIDINVAHAGSPRVFIPEGTACDFEFGNGTYHPLPASGGA